MDIPLRDPVHGLNKLSGVLGIPEWWPTGARIGVAMAHGAQEDMNTPLLETLQKRLTDGGFLTIRFNFPFAEAGKKKPDEESVLEDAYRAALNVLGRDPTAAPAHIFLGGVHLGARIVASLCAKRLRADGVFLMGYPLHPQGKPEDIDAQPLFRAIAPLLFLEGSRDRFCEPAALRKTLLRVGAPYRLHVVEDADHRFQVLRKSGRTDEEVFDEMGEELEGWLHGILGS